MKYLLIFSTLFAVIFGYAQTGSFTKSISFQNPDYQETRNLYFYVPTDYSTSATYKLVVGFRGGPHANAGHFRDQLIFMADSLDAIILCPENSHHFNNQEGLTKQLFKYSVDSTLAMYPNIDTNYIYLTGLSYGGRHAVIVGMDTDNGSIPKLRGIIPFATGQNGHLQPDYADVADFAPACICIGLLDNSTFKNVANTLHNDIQAAGGTSLLNEIPNVGHTTAFTTYPNEMMECIRFIEDSYTVGVENETTNDQLVVSPNPTNGRIKFNWERQLPDRIKVFNLQGDMVLNIVPQNNSIELSHLPDGNYLIQFSLNGKKSTQKITLVK